jgi:hypothetical protein
MSMPGFVKRQRREKMDKEGRVVYVCDDDMGEGFLVMFQSPSLSVNVTVH